MPPSPGGQFRPRDELAGEWKGALETHAGAHELQMKILTSGDVHVRLGNQLWTLLNQVSFTGETLRGIMMGDIRTEDASRRPHQIRLALRLRGNKLNGPASAVSVPGRRAGNALTSWVELTKQ
jgi:hypothetical protein